MRAMVHHHHCLTARRKLRAPALLLLLLISLHDFHQCTTDAWTPPPARPPPSRQTTITTRRTSTLPTAQIMPDGGVRPCVIRVLGVGGGGCNAVSDDRHGSAPLCWLVQSRAATTKVKLKQSSTPLCRSFYSYPSILFRVVLAHTIILLSSGRSHARQQN